MLLAKMFISFLISNWIYAEICYFFPPFQDLARRFYSSVQIPTHNKWPQIAESQEGSRLGRAISNNIKNSSLGDKWPVSAFFDQKLSDLWNSAALRDIFGALGMSGSEDRRALVIRDRAMFVREAWHPNFRQANMPKQFVYVPAAGSLYRFLGKGKDFVLVNSVEDVNSILNDTHNLLEPVS